MSTSDQCPICVFALGDDFEEPDLEKILCRENVKDLEVVVVSVAGRFRQGKSFLLNMMIRFLRAGGTSEWSTDKNAALDGFEWKHAFETVTKGVLIWPEVFKVELPNQGTVAVVLMDTEGVFDVDNSPVDDTRIFSFSAILSSVQIFNIVDRIGADIISNLEIFAGYGKLLKGGKTNAAASKPFQDLALLIRDWKYPSKYPYGWEGGQDYSNKTLYKMASSSNGKLASMGNHLHDSFESTRCFLMPHPGVTVASSPDFRGNFGEIADDFVTETEKLFKGLFNPEKLVRKKINGKSLTLLDWCYQSGQYCRHLRLSNGNLPIVQTVYEANLNVTNIAVIKKCADSYSEEMSDLLREHTYTEPRLLELHDDAKAKAIELYRCSSKMGNAKLWDAFEGQLIKGLTMTFQERFLTLNRSRRILEQKEQELERIESDRKGLEEQVEAQAAEAAEREKKLSEAESELEARGIRLQKLEESAVQDEEKLREAREQLEDTRAQHQRLAEEQEAQRSSVEEMQARLAKVEEDKGRLEKETKEAVAVYVENQQKKRGTFEYVGKKADELCDASIDLAKNIWTKIVGIF